MKFTSEIMIQTTQKIVSVLAVLSRRLMIQRIIILTLQKVQRIIVYGISAERLGATLKADLCISLQMQSI